MRLLSLLIVVSGVIFAQAPGRQKRIVTDAEVATVHQSAILIDTHNDVTSSTVAGMDIGIEVVGIDVAVVPPEVDVDGLDREGVATPILRDDAWVLG